MYGATVKISAKVVCITVESIKFKILIRKRKIPKKSLKFNVL